MSRTLFVQPRDICPSETLQGLVGDKQLSLTNSSMSLPLKFVSPGSTRSPVVKCVGFDVYPVGTGPHGQGFEWNQPACQSSELRTVIACWLGS